MSSLTGPVPVPPLSSAYSCFKFSISAFKESRSFLVIKISLETGRTSFNLSDRAYLSLISKIITAPSLPAETRYLSSEVTHIF